MQPVVTFEDSRRLTGYNLYFDRVGAVLETVGEPPDEACLLAWAARAERMRSRLDWPPGPLLWRAHASGASLALAAPFDQLFCATELNEWAWLAGRAAQAREPFHAPGYAAAWDEASAQQTLAAFAAAERNPALIALIDAAAAHRLTTLIDDEVVSIGSGDGVAQWPMAWLPAPARIDWARLHDVPITLVTGSNGKTTSVRLLAAMQRAHGWRTAYSCTDGVYLDGVALATGDYSGPAGARAVLRETSATAAILETARGGMLRRGLAPARVDVALVTNVSVDHFGEYGIHDLAALASVKLIVARAVPADGLLVLNADDALLVAQAQNLACPRAWFALDDAHPLLRQQRAAGASTCGVRDGRLHLTMGGQSHDLGAIDAMPLSFGGSARYNIANIAGAALCAHALGVAPPTIAAVLHEFGARHGDNPGRLQHWRYGALQVFLDYAHNAQGLRGLLDVATVSRGDARLALVLGQAGNREDREIAELADVAAGYRPDRIVLKEIGGMLRGRAPGEVPAILHRALRAVDIDATAIVACDDEIDAAANALAWAGAADIVVLPIHGSVARRVIVTWLDALHAAQWRPGQPLPPAAAPSAAG